MAYTEMENFNPIQVIDLSFQVHYVTATKTLPFEKYRSNPDNVHVDASFFTMFTRRRELKVLSDGKQLLRIKI